MSSNGTCDYLEWDILFLVQTVIFYPLSIVAIISQVICISLIPKVGIFPANVKLLLVSVSVAALFTCFTFLIRAVHNTVILVTGFGPFALTMPICFAVDAPYGTGTTFVVLALLAISLERGYETARFRSESARKSEKPTVLAIILVISVFVLCPVFPTLTATSVAKVSRIMCYCSAAVVHERYDTWTIKSFYFAVEGLTLILTWWVWRVNRNRLADFNINTREHDLRSRFHASNNMKTTAMLFPYVLTHAVFYLVIMISTNTLSLLTQLNTDLSMNFLNQTMPLINGQVFLTVVSCLDFVIGPFIWMRNHQGLKTLAGTKYPFLKKFLWKNSKVEPTNAAIVVNPGSDGKAKMTTAALGAMANVVEYRVKPEHHHQILEHLWAKK